MNVLVLNCGSSSLKFQVIDTSPEAIEQDKDVRRARGTIERIGSEALLTFEAEGKPVRRLAEPLRDHRAALERVLRWLVEGDGDKPLLGELKEIEHFFRVYKDLEGTHTETRGFEGAAAARAAITRAMALYEERFGGDAAGSPLTFSQ